jgi:hypothetical protein
VAATLRVPPLALRGPVCPSRSDLPPEPASPGWHPVRCGHPYVSSDALGMGSRKRAGLVLCGYEAVTMYLMAVMWRGSRLPAVDARDRAGCRAVEHVQRRAPACCAGVPWQVNVLRARNRILLKCPDRA